MGDYSVSREQFDPDNFVSRKIFQHGTRIVDSDMNEQVLIDLHRQRRISYGLMGQIDQRIGIGFAFKSGGVNEVSLNKGDAFVEMTDDGIGGTHHIYKEDDTIITGFTTPSSGDRTDSVYLDIYFEIIDSDDDTGLINPDVAAESAVDIRAKMDWLKIEGASIPSAPAGHTYVGLLQIDRLDGNANITEAMCTNLLEKFDDWLEEDGTVSLKGDMAVDAGIKIDGVDVSVLKTDHDTLTTDFEAFRDDVFYAKESDVLYVQSDEHPYETDGALDDGASYDHRWTETTSLTNVLKLHLWIRKMPLWTKLALRANLLIDSATAGPHVVGEAKLDATAYDLSGQVTPDLANYITWNLSGYSDWDIMELRVYIKAHTGPVRTSVRGLIVLGEYSS